MPPDVTPAGPVVGPGGRPVTRRQRGWVRLAVGLVLLVGGVGAFVVGLLDVIGKADAARDDAVAEGEVRGVGPTATQTFTAPSTGSAYTIYLVAGGGNDDDREREVASTTCQVVFADGGTATISGSRQGASTTVGDLRSIGTFSASEGPTAVACGWQEPSRIDRGRGAARTWLVSPGRPSDLAGGIVLLVGGVFVALAGGALAAWGAVGRHVAA